MTPPANERVLLIVNPAARSAERDRAEAERALMAAKARFLVLATEAPGHAQELAEEHGDGFDAVLALGGDGTAAEVISALHGDGPPVGVLPGGTGNLLARALKIPLRIKDAVPALLSGVERRFDLGRFADGRHFVIGLGVGVDEAMIANASRKLKHRLGFLAYFWSGTIASLRMEKVRYRLTVDGTVREGQAISVMVANLGEILGGLIKLGDQVRPDDGRLDAIAFAPDTVLDAVRIFGRMLRGTLSDDRCMVYLSGTSVRLETMPARRAQADGELLGNSPFEITVVPAAARLLAPRS